MVSGRTSVSGPGRAPDRERRAAGVADRRRCRGRLVAVTGSWDGQVQMWDVAAGTEVTGRASPTAHTGPVWALATAVVDGRPLVATGGDDRTVRVWDMAAHRQVGADLVFPTEVTAVTMASDGRLTVGLGGDTAALAPHPHV
ncbi:WD40 repeat domain-containing protein [Streptomyces sp. NPDC013953]|uniref:WD40 repeat domain-containing protein n=1 Tax=Streptomyces sp. NPDC013953 TaxID=3364868 RepID=UPI0036FF1A39